MCVCVCVRVCVWPQVDSFGSKKVLYPSEAAYREHCLDLQNSISMEHLRMLLDLGNRESLSWILCKHTYTQSQEVTRSHVNEL